MTLDYNRFCDMVIEGFSGACSRILSFEPDPRSSTRPDIAVLWLFADHVLLLAQRPIYAELRLVDEHGVAVRVFSTLAHQDRALLDGAATRTLAEPSHVGVAKYDDATSIHLSVGRFDGRNEIDEVFESTSIAAVALAAMERLLLHAAGLLQPAMLRLKADHPPPAPSEPVMVVDEDHWQRQMEAVRRRLDKVLVHWARRRFGTEDALLFPPDESGRTRLFVATRMPFTTKYFGDSQPVLREVAPGCTYDFTARMIWTSSQLEEREYTADGHRTILESPLGLKSRSIGCSSFVTGVVDIGTVGERTGATGRNREIATGEIDSRRRDLESRPETYGLAARQESIFYIPIHIGGIPWLELYCFMPEAKGEEVVRSMERRYLIYRDAVPVLAEQLTTAVVTAFAESLAREAAAHLPLAVSGDLVAFCAHVTASWKQVCDVFPFDDVELRYKSMHGSNTAAQDQRQQPEDHGDERFFKLDLPGVERALCCHFVERKPQVPYRLIDPYLVTELVERTLVAQIAETSAHYRAALLAFGHYLGGTLHESAFGEVLVRAHRDPMLRDSGFPELVDFTASRLRIASGLGEAMRMLKLSGRGIPRDWLSPAFLSGSRPKPAELVEAGALNAMYYLAPTWRHSERASQWTASVHTKDGERWLRWDDEGGPTASARRLIREASEVCDLPPFRGPGSRATGTIACTLGLAEIVRNACTGARSVAEQHPAANGCELLRVIVTLDSLGLDDARLTVRVLNAVSRPIEDGELVSLWFVDFIEKRLVLDERQQICMTRPPETCDAPGDHPWPYWVEASWTYYFNRVVPAPRHSRSVT